MKYVLRTLGLPFFLGLQIIWLLFVVGLKTYLWFRYGGEVIAYNDKMNRRTVSDVFYAVQEGLKVGYGLGR